MGLTVFQKLVLHALALLLWNGGMAQAARLLRGLALGHHTDSQKESAMDDWLRSETDIKRKGLPGECHDCMKEFE